MSENEILLKKAAKGDSDAFIALVTPHEKMIYAVCLRMMGSEADAKDCAQDAIMRAYRSIGGYEPRAAFATWLYRIAYNICLDALRSRKRHPAQSLESKQENEGFEIPDNRSPYDHLEQKERLDVLNRAMNQLEGDDKAILLMRSGQGLSYEEIAQALSLPAGTVKSKLSRAREKLKKILWADRELFPFSAVIQDEGRKQK